MATTLDWVKSLRADIRGDCGKGWDLRGRDVGGKMVMQIDGNDENGRSTLLTNIGWRKDNKRNILNAIVEIKDFIYHNGDTLKEAYKKFSNQSEYAPVIKGQLKGWAANKKAFLDSRSNRRSIPLYDLTKRVELACRFLENSPKPQNANDLFLRIKEEYFDVALLFEDIKDPEIKARKILTQLENHKLIIDNCKVRNKVETKWYWIKELFWELWDSKELNISIGLVFNMVNYF